MNEENNVVGLYAFLDSKGVQPKSVQQNTAELNDLLGKNGINLCEISYSWQSSPKEMKCCYEIERSMCNLEDIEVSVLENIRIGELEIAISEKESGVVHVMQIRDQADKIVDILNKNKTLYLRDFKK